MKTLIGTDITSRMESFWRKLRHVRDLIEYDGPLLSLYAMESGTSILVYWCDCDKTLNRWMLVKVTPGALLALESGTITLRDSITKSPYSVVMMDYKSLPMRQESKTFLEVHKTDIPEDYLPHPTARLTEFHREPFTEEDRNAASDETRSDREDEVSR